MIVLIFVFLTALIGRGSGDMLVLERSANWPTNLNAMKSRDEARHGRLLAVELPLNGSASPAINNGMYITQIRLGNPPKEFRVDFDTGSDLFWVTCNTCIECILNGQVGQKSFEPSATSYMTCSDSRCKSNFTHCSDSGYMSCSFNYTYADRSGSSGHMVSSTVYLDVNSDSKTPIDFGCANELHGSFATTDRDIDGVLGFGQNNLSFFSQLYSAGISPGVFSHCLKRSPDAGGYVFLGKTTVPDLVYTPLIRSETHYKVMLQSIAVNGKQISVGSSVFPATTSSETMIDSGTTLAYLTDKAFDPFVQAIESNVSPLFEAVHVGGDLCFRLTNNSVIPEFPEVTLNFEGGAVMKLMADDYLIQENFENNDTSQWCLSWRKTHGETVLGDVILKNKIIEYDVAKQRIGWKSFNCDLFATVAMSAGVAPSSYMLAAILIVNILFV